MTHLILRKHRKNRKKRKMKVLYAVIFLGLYTIPPVSGKCKTDEVEICSKDPKGCFCRTCILCPKGYGPSHQCGGRYLNGTVITCKPCISGKSYSEEHSISSCQPCPQCGGKETLQKCTPRRETSCGTKCREGYIVSLAVDDCIPDRSFMASQQVNTTKLTTAHLSKTTIPSSTTSGPTQVRTTQREMHITTKPSHLDTPGKSGQPNSKDSDADHSRDNKIIILTLTGIAVVVVVVCFLRKKQVACFKKTCKDERNGVEKKPLTSKESPRTSQEIEPWPDDLRLTNIPQTLRSKVANKISRESSTNWRHIGEALELSPDDLEGIEVNGPKKGTNEGLQLLEILESCRPNLTLTEFVKTLENQRRKDITKMIRDHYQELNTVAVKRKELQDNQVRPEPV